MVWFTAELVVLILSPMLPPTLNPPPLTLTSPAIVPATPPARITNAPAPFLIPLPL